MFQEPAKDVHVTRGFSYKKSLHQIPAPRDLCRDVRKGGVRSTVSLGKNSFPFQIEDLGVSDILISADDVSIKICPY